MKTQTTTFSWPVASAATVAAPAAARPAAVTEVVPRADGLRVALRWVGLLAAGQMVLFVVIFLFLCAVGDAAPAVNPLELRVSEYAPTAARDPFGGQPVAAASGATVAPIPAPVELKLQGILYHATRPAALVNDKTVELNKPVTVKTGAGEVEIRALEITREIVLLEVGGQKLELRLGAADRNNPEK